MRAYRETLFFMLDASRLTFHLSRIIHGTGGPERGRAARLAFLALLSAGIMAAAALLPPIPQDPLYHRFADTAGFWGIPNFLNVVSNLPLLLVGAWGLVFLGRSRPAVFRTPRERWPYRVFFLGVALTAAGSMYYHHAPDNHTLVWDRLPMTLAFMGLLSAQIAERIHRRLGLALLLPLLAAGAASVLYWSWSEAAGAGDLRPYLLVQGYGILLMVLMAVLFRSRYSRGGDILAVAAIYLAALAFDLLDSRIYALGHVVSGHSVKHLTAAAAAGWVLRHLMLRHPAPGCGRY